MRRVIYDLSGSDHPTPVQCNGFLEVEAAFARTFVLGMARAAPSEGLAAQHRVPLATTLKAPFPRATVYRVMWHLDMG